MGEVVVWSGTIERASCEENRRPPDPPRYGLQAGELEDPAPGKPRTRAELIVEYLKGRDDATSHELAQMLQASQGATSPVVYQMLKRGLLVPSGRIVKRKVGRGGRAYKLAVPVRRSQATTASDVVARLREVSSATADELALYLDLPTTVVTSACFRLVAAKAVTKTERLEHVTRRRIPVRYSLALQQREEPRGDVHAERPPEPGRKADG